MATLTVGSGQQYTTIAAAVAAAQSGDMINVKAGTYTNDFISDKDKNLTLQAVGGPVKLVATVNAPDGKAIITEGSGGATLTINGFDISGAKVPDGNGAAIRYEGGRLILNNVYIHNNQNGILTANAPTGSIAINNSEFAFNGTGDGRTHNIYVGDIGTLSINNSYIHDAKVGHEIKSRAENTTITNSRIFDNNSTASYSIDLPNGGIATIRNNVIEQGPNSDNGFIIAYGEEAKLHSGTAVMISQNTIVNDKPGGVAVLNKAPNALSFKDNSLWGLTSAQLVNGNLAASGTIFLGTRPTFGASPIPNGNNSTGTDTDTVAISATQSGVVVSDSNVAILATAGNHMVFIGGTHDAAILTGGIENVQALQGYNSITTGAFNDTIAIAGTGNVVNGGDATNSITDSGTGNTIVVPTPWKGMDNVFGRVLTNGDKLDFTTALKATKWDGVASHLGSYLHVSSTSGGDAIIRVSVDTRTDGGGAEVLRLHGVGQVDYSTILAHAIT